MDQHQRLNLKNMIKEYNSEETTEKIRTLKHSKKIRTDILKLNEFRKKYSRISTTNQYKMMARNRFPFLYNNYMNIFHRFLKGELDINLLLTFVNLLEKIEKGDMDQHEASFQVGTILKKLYIDSALRQDKKRDKTKNVKKKKPIKNISWNEFKMLES